MQVRERTDSFMRLFLGIAGLILFMGVELFCTPLFSAPTDAEKKAAELQAEQMNRMRENTFQMTKVDDAIMSDSQAEGKEDKPEMFEKYSEPVNSQSQVKSNYKEPVVEMKSMKEVEAMLGAYESDEVLKQLADAKAAEEKIAAQGGKSSSGVSVNPLNPNERKQQSCYETEPGKVECVEISSPIDLSVQEPPVRK